jgi:hypothetical protein
MGRTFDDGAPRLELWLWRRSPGCCARNFGTAPIERTRESPRAGDQRPPRVGPVTAGCGRKQNCPAPPGAAEIAAAQVLGRDDVGKLDDLLVGVVRADSLEELVRDVVRRRARAFGVLEGDPLGIRVVRARPVAEKIGDLLQTGPGLAATGSVAVRSIRTTDDVRDADIDEAAQRRIDQAALLDRPAECPMGRRDAGPVGAMRVPRETRPRGRVLSRARTRVLPVRADGVSLGMVCLLGEFALRCRVLPGDHIRLDTGRRPTCARERAL